jgi:type IV secretion system protein VirD4
MTRLAFLSVPLIIVSALLGYWNLTHGFKPGRPEHWRWLFDWWWQYQEMPDGMGFSLKIAAAGLAVSLFIVSWLLARAGARTLQGDHEEDTLHGSARWAKRSDIKAAGLLANEGVVVGGWKSGRKVQTLRHDGPEHVLVFAPTRSGKGVGLVLPTLLSWRHSALVLDIKGENHALTAGWRASQGQRIFKFDPTAISGSVRFNPLAEVRVGSDHEIADAQNIAAMIIDPEGKGLKDFWMKSGFAWLTAGILHTLYRMQREHGRRATLSDVGRNMSAPGDGIEVMLQGMLDFDHGRTAINNLVHQAAQTMLDRAPAERSGVHSSALTELDLYRDPIVAANISGSDFKLDDLMNGDKPATLYLVVPPSDIDRLRPLLRVVLNLFLRRLTAEMAFENGAPKQTYRHRLLLMLDEFTSIGKLEIFERALAFMAGYGLKAFIIVQDLTQLQKEYGREESIMSNCHIRIAYAPNKIETAKILSDLTGKTTVVQKRRSQSRRAHEFVGSTSESIAATGRALLTPDECMQLPGLEKAADGKVKKAGDMLIFPAGFRPIYGRQALFFQDKEMLRCSKIVPPQAVRKAMKIDEDGLPTIPSYAEIIFEKT